MERAGENDVLPAACFIVANLEAMMVPARVDPLAPPTERITRSAPVPEPMSLAIRAFWALVIEPIRQVPTPNPVMISPAIIIQTGAYSGISANRMRPVTHRIVAM